MATRLRTIITVRTAKTAYKCYICHKFIKSNTQYERCWEPDNGLYYKRCMTCGGGWGGRQ